MKYPEGPGVISNRYQEGDPGAGVDATTLRAVDMNSLTYEIINVILDAGIALNSAEENQLLQAIDAKLVPYITEAEADAAYLSSATPVPVANGGTGATSGAAALQNVGIYFGRVSSAGAEIRLPDGWSCIRVSTGQYQVMHNFGSTDYLVLSQVNRFTTSANIVSGPSTIGINQFDIFVADNSGTLFDADTAFLLLKY